MSKVAQAQEMLREVVRLALEGRENGHIAEQVALSPATVAALLEASSTRMLVKVKRL